MPHPGSRTQRPMHAPAADLSTWSALLAGLAYTALALHVLRSGNLHPGQGRSSLLFAGAILASAAWGWAGVSASYGALGSLAAAVFDLLRYACWFAFILSLLAPAMAERRQRSLALLIPAATLVVALGVAIVAFVLVAPGRTATVFRLFEALALPLLGLVLVEQLFRNVSDESRWNAKPLCLGLCVILLFDLYVYSQAVLFGVLDRDAVSVRGAIHALAVPLLFMASRRRRDWITRLKVSRTAAFHSAALVLAGIYLLFVAAVGYYIRFFGGEWGAALQLAALFVALTALVVLAVSGAMRSRLRVLVGKHFFNYRYDYREEWLRFTAMLSAKSSPSEMGVLVIRGMADMVESPSGALWTQEPGGREYVQTARWNSPASTEREPVDSALCQFLLRTGWIVELERYRAGTEHYPGLTLPAWLASPGQYWLAIPLIVGEELLGFVTLGPARTPVDINWEVTDLLKTASRQAAGFLAQMLTTEALLEARKFDAFNRMSAFVVHDLKNIVAQLSLMLGNAKRLHANPEFQQDMMATVENSLEKMRQLMLQLREGEAPVAGRSGVDLVPIVRRIEEVVARRGRTIDVQVIDAVVTRGHESRIERVIGHVVQNALDATDGNDKVWLKLRRQSGQAQVEVGDTGSGMSREYVQTALFKPFHTTKKAGLGIGAYESYQYVRELGGSVSVDSEPGRGTVMTISLPLFEAHQASALRMVSAK
jgi:putative PEP-CTERM system histidine kinase